MAQFAVHENANPQTRAAYPFLLDVQSDLVASLATRVVVPLCPASDLRGRTITSLMPRLQVADSSCVMLTPQLAGVPLKALGREVASVAHERAAIIGALDLLFTGF